jgi:hypothetical protein
LPSRWTVGAADEPGSPSAEGKIALFSTACPFRPALPVGAWQLVKLFCGFASAIAVPANVSAATTASANNFVVKGTSINSPLASSANSMVSQTFQWATFYNVLAPIADGYAGSLLYTSRSKERSSACNELTF